MTTFKFNVNVPLRGLLDNFAKNEHFIADCGLLLEADEAAINCLIDRLNAITDCSVSPKLQSILEECGLSESVRISHLIEKIRRLSVDFGIPASVLSEEFNDFVIRRFGDFSQDDCEKLASTVDGIITSRGFELQEKAQRLRDTGPELESIELISDLRPVFSIDKENIIAGMPIVTAFLSISDSQSPVVFRIRESDIRELAEKFNLLVKKVEQTRSLCESSQIHTVVTYTEE